MKHLSKLFVIGLMVTMSCSNDDFKTTTQESKEYAARENRASYDDIDYEEFVKFYPDFNLDYLQETMLALETHPSES